MRHIKDVETRHEQDRNAVIQELCGYPTFANCAPEDVAALVAAGSEFRLPPEWSLLQEGIPADACYVIRAGTARVFDGRNEIATLGPGDLIGEMAYLGGGQRRATVSSVTRLTGIRIDYDTLRTVIARRPQLHDVIKAVYDSRVA